MELQDIKSMTLAEIQESFTNDKLPKFRALQVYQWLHRGAESFDEMSNLSKELREQLKAKYYISVVPHKWVVEWAAHFVLQVKAVLAAI